MSSKLKIKGKKDRYKPLAPLNIGSMSIEQLSENIGCKRESLLIWMEAREKEMREELQQEFNENLYKCEDYIAVANILSSLMAIHMTWKFKEATRRFIDNYNEAQKIVDSTGIVETYKMMHDEWGIEIEFEEVDLNEMFGWND